MQASFLAPLALILWPILSLQFFRRVDPGTATMWTILGGVLLLPERYDFDFPLIPPLDKNSLPSIIALIGCLRVSARPVRLKVHRRWGTPEWLMTAFLISPFITAELNQDPYVVGGMFLRGMSHYDALSSAIKNVFIILPFILGRALYRQEGNLQHVLSYFVYAMLLYSVLTLVEVKMSPQVHHWIYGFGQHDFLQTMRFGGWRPMVFLSHGLQLGLFTAMAFVSGLVLWKTDIRIHQWSAGKVSIYLGVVLVLCKSTASIIYGALLAALILLTQPRTQIRVACLLAAFVIAYPLVRFQGWIDTKALVENAAGYNAERAESLQFRFGNEERLAEHARQRPIFGWGGWARDRVFDPKTGADITVTDGQWIITLCQFGLFGFIAQFGLLALPVFRARKGLTSCGSAVERAQFAGVALLLVVNLVDMLPNAFLSSFVWLLAGALLGRSEALIQARAYVPRHVPAKPALPTKEPTGTFPSPYRS
jgi:hypothetical protein